MSKKPSVKSTNKTAPVAEKKKKSDLKKKKKS